MLDYLNIAESAIAVLSDKKRRNPTGNYTVIYIELFSCILLLFFWTEHGRIRVHAGTLWERFTPRFPPHRQSSPGTHSGRAGLNEVKQACGCE